MKLIAHPNNAQTLFWIALILLALFAFTVNGQKFPGVKVNDSTYVILESNYSPVPIFMKDTLKTFRLISTNGMYTMFYTYFEGDPEEHIVEVRIKKYIPPTQTSIKIEAESAVSVINASKVGTIIGNILPGAIIKYSPVDIGTRTKVKFRYSRGYTGPSSMKMKIGTVSKDLEFPSTGGWGIYQDIEFTVTSSGGNVPIELTSAVLGPCNFDYFIFQ